MHTYVFICIYVYVCVYMYIYFIIIRYNDMYPNCQPFSQGIHLLPYAGLVGKWTFLFIACAKHWPFQLEKGTYIRIWTEFQFSSLLQGILVLNVVKQGSLCQCFAGIKIEFSNFSFCYFQRNSGTSIRSRFRRKINFL